jgi:hypothetical protein
MNLPAVAADVRRLKLLGREGRSEPPDVGCGCDGRDWASVGTAEDKRRTNGDWRMAIGGVVIELRTSDF